MKITPFLTIAVFALAFVFAGCESTSSTTSEPTAARGSALNTHAGTAGAPSQSGAPHQ